MMPIRRYFVVVVAQVLLLALLIPLGMGAHRATARPLVAGQPSILVGPNIHVSRESDAPHVETTIAAHPIDTNLLIGSAIHLVEAHKVALKRKVYISRDRGQSWTYAYLPVPVSHLATAGGLFGWDPIVAFGATGTMLVNYTDRPLNRSVDGGKSWTVATRKDLLGPLWPGDRETIGVDWSNSKYRGRVYVITNDLGRESKGTLLRSLDDGETFEAPVSLFHKPEHIAQALYPLVLSDGAVFIMTGQGATSGTPAHIASYYGVLSTDGGGTFSERFKVFDWYKASDESTTCHQSTPAFAVGNPRGQWSAVDPSEQSPFRDRLYVAWMDCRSGSWRAFFSSSSDRGRSWSAPRPISPQVPTWAAQFQVSIAVNSAGIVGIQWYDTRDDERGEQFHLYFSASVDGGQTFLPAVRVSSAPSVPRGKGNTKPVVDVSIAMRGGKSAGHFRPSYGPTAAENRHSHGGDYVGLIADAGGIFHPFWADARSGTSYQLYTAQVQVIAALPAGPVAAPSSSCDQAARVPAASVSVKDFMVLEVDQAQYDSARQEVVIPVRLRNISPDTLCGPFMVGLMAYDSATLAALRQSAFEADVPIKPTLYHAYQQRGALRDLPYLAPRATTEPVLWRLPFGKAFSGNDGALLYEVKGPPRLSEPAARH